MLLRDPFFFLRPVHHKGALGRSGNAGNFGVGSFAAGSFTLGSFTFGNFTFGSLTLGRDKSSPDDQFLG
jgi:hypothetical protein